MWIRTQRCGAGGALLLAVTLSAGAQDPSSVQSPSVSANGSVVIAIEPAEIEVAEIKPAGDDVWWHGPPSPQTNDESAPPAAVEAEPVQLSSIKDTFVAEAVEVDETDETAGNATPQELMLAGAPIVVIEPAANESLKLGSPNGIFSSRPAAAEVADIVADDEQAAAKSSWLTALDPRRNQVLRVVASLGVVLGLLVLIRFLMTRGAGLFGQSGRPSGVIEILARYPLGRKQSLVLIKLARRVILVHQTGGQMTTLSEVNEPMEVASLLARIEAGSSGKQAQRFQSMLRRFESEHDAMRAKGDSSDPFAMLGDTSSPGEVIDLTRRRPRTSGLGKRRISA